MYAHSSPVIVLCRQPLFKGILDPHGVHLNKNKKRGQDRARHKGARSVVVVVVVVVVDAVVVVAAAAAAAAAVEAAATAAAAAAAPPPGGLALEYTFSSFLNLVPYVSAAVTRVPKPVR